MVYIQAIKYRAAIFLYSIRLTLNWSLISFDTKWYLYGLEPNFRLIGDFNGKTIRTVIWVNSIVLSEFHYSWGSLKYLYIRYVLTETLKRY